MSVSAIAASGVIQAEAGFQKAAVNLSNATNPVDTVSLSDAAVALTQQSLAFATAIKTLKLADDLEKTAISVLA